MSFDHASPLQERSHSWKFYFKSEAKANVSPVDYAESPISELYALFLKDVCFANLLVVCASPLPFPLSIDFGTLSGDLGSFPFDHEPYHP